MKNSFNAREWEFGQTMTNGIVDFAKLLFIPFKWNEFSFWQARISNIFFFCVSQTPFCKQTHNYSVEKECWAINWSEMKDPRWNILLKFAFFFLKWENDNEKKRIKKEIVNRNIERRIFNFFPFACRRKMSGICRSCKLSTNSSWKITT